MPISLIYLCVMLVVICIWFIAFKRPVYEAVFVSFMLLLVLTGTWRNVLGYIDSGLSTSLLYSMAAFVAMSIIMTETKVIDGCITIILSILGRVTGGAGYVSVISSSFMGALSGSGPGNVMSTGVITIPAMKKSGFPAELAGNIESNASYLGNMIPPSSNIVAALGAFTALYPAVNLTIGQFWVILWGVSIWFILQRLLMVFAFCKYYGVKPLSKDELPNLGKALEDGWQGLLLPILILVPFILDYLFKDTFFTARLGEAGAKSLSSSMLIFVPGIAALYACGITKEKGAIKMDRLAELFGRNVKTISPTIGVCLFGYMIGALFAELDVATEMETFILGFAFSKLGMVMFLCVITCILGMVVPGSSIVVIFGPVFITSLASVGVAPLLAAAMLPCICGVMCGITPPLGLGMYAGMSISGGDFGKTFKNNLWWVVAQFALQIVVLMGWLPIFGI